MSSKDAPNWAEYNASRLKPVKGYGKGRRIEAPRAEPKAVDIEVQETRIPDDTTATGVQRIIKAWKGGL